MFREILTLGDKIDIKRLDRNGQPINDLKTYVSQLMDFEDSDIIHIATPIINSTLAILNVGESYSLCFYTAKGLYQCNCVILKNFKENLTVIAVARITTDLERFQRRQFYRLECIIDILYRVITKEEEILDRKLKMEDFRNNEERNICRKRILQLGSEWTPASITDLSGGGARFTTSVMLNQGDRVKIQMDISFGAVIRNLVLEAGVISSHRIENRSGAYENRAEFTDINKKDREDLIKYIFEQERQCRKKDKR